MKKDRAFPKTNLRHQRSWGGKRESFIFMTPVFPKYAMSSRDGSVSTWSSITLPSKAKDSPGSSIKINPLRSFSRIYKPSQISNFILRRMGKSCILGSLKLHQDEDHFLKQFFINP